jgi:hypothetical protein
MRLASLGRDLCCQAIAVSRAVKSTPLKKFLTASAVDWMGKIWLYPLELE